MLARRDRAAGERIARRHHRQHAIALVLVLGRIVPAFLVDLEEAREGHGLAGGPKADRIVRRGDIHDHPVEHGARHLAGHGPLPDQLVEPALIVVEEARDPVRRAAEIGRPDRLVGFLGILGLGLVQARIGRQEALAIHASDLLAAGGQRLARQLHAVGPHIGDQADGLAIDVGALEQALGGAHGARCAKAQLARGLLLQGRGRERRRRVALDLLLLEVLDRELAALDQVEGALGGGFVGEIEAVQLLAVEPGKAGREGLVARRREGRLDAPIFARQEGVDLGFALADQAQRHRLDPAGRARALELAPQHRREREADQVVERPARLVGVDQADIEVARMLHRLQDCALGDLVEHHPLDVDALDHALILERRQQMPGDRLAFAIRVGGEVEMIGRAQRLGDVGDPLPLVGERLVDHPEVLVRQDRAVLLRQVADMAVARQHGVARPQVLVDGLGLGRRFDDNYIHATMTILPVGAPTRPATLGVH